MSFSTFRVTVGRVILIAGILVLLFIPYLLWGTGLITARAQSDLRQEFAAARRTHHETAPLRSAAATTVPPIVAPSTAAPAVGSPVGVISIPKIALSMVVVEGTGTDQLRSGPGHYTGTPLPGEAGNVAIAGHRTTYLHPFYDLNELVPGDAIDILTVQGLFIYHVVNSQTVSPSDVDVVAASASPMLTLTTCTPRYSASQRLVVQADLVADILSGTRPPVQRQTNKPQAPAPEPIQKHWGPAVAWGVVVAVLITAIWAAALRLRGGRRMAAVGVGLIVWLAAVFVFFGALAPLLPASY